MNAIKDHGLTRVVVASCSPRTHMPLSERVRRGGADQYLFEMANIRDPVFLGSRSGSGLAQIKAMDLIRMAVAKARFLEPAGNRIFLVRPRVVIGGGVAGLSAAGALADMGMEIILGGKPGRARRPAASDHRIARAAKSFGAGGTLVAEFESKPRSQGAAGE